MRQSMKSPALTRVAILSLDMGISLSHNLGFAVKVNESKLHPTVGRREKSS